MTPTSTATLLTMLCGAILIPQATRGPVDRWPAKPQPPLYRSDPYESRIGLSVDVGATSEVILAPKVLQATGGEFNIDFVTAGNWTLADPSALKTSVRINGSPVDITPTVRGKQGDEVYNVGIRIPAANINTLSFRAEWPVIAFNSTVDEARAATITWPREWPPEVQPYLAPGPYIQSESPRYTSFVQRVSEGKLRTVPLYYAAKDLVRAAILEHRNVQPNFVFAENGGAIRGFDLLPHRGIRDRYLGGRPSNTPTAPDLVCDCIAVLRAAGIPARPVIGVQSGNALQPALVTSRVRLVAWGEFYLPSAGWVPFDPNLMRGTSMRTMNVRKEWSFFGTLKHLNRRAAIAYEFAPFSRGWISEFPAGWTLAVSGRADGPFEFVDVTTPILVNKGPITR